MAEKEIREVFSDLAVDLCRSGEERREHGAAGIKIRKEELHDSH